MILSPKFTRLINLRFCQYIKASSSAGDLELMVEDAVAHVGGARQAVSFAKKRHMLWEVCFLAEWSPPTVSLRHLFFPSHHWPFFFLMYSIGLHIQY